MATILVLACGFLGAVAGIVALAAGAGFGVALALWLGLGPAAAVLAALWSFAPARHPAGLQGA